MADTWLSAPIWREWAALTRLQWGGRIAFREEVARAERMMAGGETSIAEADSGGEYTTSLLRHREAMADTDLFWTLIFLRSFALLETHAKLVSHIVETRRWDLLSGKLSEAELQHVNSRRLEGGIDAWMTQVLRGCGQDWSMVYQGVAGMVEVAQVRNAIAHGVLHCTETQREKARRLAYGWPFEVGEPLQISFGLLHEYRGRIRSTCRITCDGIYHMYRGSHRNPV
ncbi:hypothetical protein V6B08_03205 [Ferrovibrio sp. MS7]|uniref:hypothetical protein n=1 Tax=Ferrovibrio plantarum TaxID=3119164 RepID=UPI003136BEFF